MGNIWCLTYDPLAFVFDRQPYLFLSVSDIVNSLLGKQFTCQRIVDLPNRYTWLLSRDKETPCFRVNEHLTIDEKSVQMFNKTDGQLKGWDVYGVEMDEEKREWVLTDGGTMLIGEQVKSKIPYLYVKHVDKNTFFATSNGLLGVYDNTKKDIVPLHIIPQGTKQISALEKDENNRLGPEVRNGYN
jgi:hypothetical protein